ncbi:MAG TPA: sugar ABC transporter ATP-binding protein [Roseiarcus sp.]|nr:sugar ABC transporter ATP-binding protein [Roseiarcus sp.]
MRLGVDNVTKRFANILALDGVSMEFAPGEIHALMGENGAGKSTLIKIITGVQKPDAGCLFLDGRRADFASPREALAAGVSAVHQERNLIPLFSVGENIMLERLPTRSGLIDYAEIDRRARETLDLLDPGIDTRAKVASLSVAQMQLVEIAKALSLKARVLLLDEPTASITNHEAAALFAVLKRLKSDGVAIVFVSHKLDEVVAISDRVSVLRDGRVAAAGEPISQVTRSRLVSLMIGREERRAEISRDHAPGETALELVEVSTSHGHANVSLALRRFEILGLYGLVGAGRTELAKAIIGVGEIKNGRLLVNGRLVVIRNPHEALTRHRIGYVSEDRKGEGLILSHPISANIAMTIWRRIASVLQLVRPSAERRAVEPFVDRLAIKAASLNQPVGALSGGNQQKVSIAKWLAAETDVLIVDEPTVGIDIKTKVELHELIGELSQRGVAVLLISSDMAEMIALADRIVVMYDFAIAGEIENDRHYETMSKAIMAMIHRGEAAPQSVGDNGHAAG